MTKEQIFESRNLPKKPFKSVWGNDTGERLYSYYKQWGFEAFLNSLEDADRNNLLDALKVK